MPINNAEITSKVQEIVTLIGDCKRWAAAQPGTSLDAHLATYIDVSLLGVLEESIEILFRVRAGRSGDIQTTNYIIKDLDKFFQNPKDGKIVEVLNKFDGSLGTAFRTRFPSGCSELRALTDINTIKENIAHKGVYNLQLTIGDVENYFNRVVPLLEELETILSR